VKRTDDGTRSREARERLAALREAMRSAPRPVRVEKKSEHWHQRAAGKILWAITLGGQRTYLDRYVTTLGHTIYVPDDFDAWHPDHAWQVLRHELVHVRQFERFGWLGMILLYGLLPLPVVLAWGRARLEWEAYEETLRAVAESEGLDAARAPELHREIVGRFTGPDYAWMWPFPRVVQGWIDDAVKRLEARP
jgi:hypothetical protein